MAAELGVRGILVLAEHNGQGPLALEEMCRQRDLPRQYMVKIFGQLARANLIRAVRGKGGGYVLARPPADITLLAVIEAVEGPLAVNLCQQTPAACPNSLACPVQPVWHDLQEKIRQALSSHTLNEFVGCAEAKK
jgi:Rrf2 family protein